MKVFQALKEKGNKKDKISQERFELNKTRASIEELCNKYLTNTEDTLRFEASEGELSNVISILQSQYFTDRYEFEQVSSTLFDIRLKAFDIL